MFGPNPNLICSCRVGNHLPKRSLHAPEPKIATPATLVTSSLLTCSGEITSFPSKVAETFPSFPTFPEPARASARASCEIRSFRADVTETFPTFPTFPDAPPQRRGMWERGECFCRRRPERHDFPTLPC